jgi:peptide deformylase
MKKIISLLKCLNPISIYNVMSCFGRFLFVNVLRNKIDNNNVYSSDDHENAKHDIFSDDTPSEKRLRLKSIIKRHYNKHRMFYFCFFFLIMIFVCGWLTHMIVHYQPLRFYDNNGNEVLNHGKVIDIAHVDIDKIKLTRKDIKHLNDTELSLGYFEYNDIWNIQYKLNMTFKVISLEMKNMCNQENCVCISSSHFGINKNIFYFPSSNISHLNDTFLLNVNIHSRSSELISVDEEVLYSHNKKLRRVRSMWIIIEYINFNTIKKNRLKLDDKYSVCVQHYLESDS